MVRDWRIEVSSLESYEINEYLSNSTRVCRRWISLWWFGPWLLRCAGLSLLPKKRGYSFLFVPLCTEIDFWRHLLTVERFNPPCIRNCCWCCQLLWRRWLPNRSCAVSKRFGWLAGIIGGICTFPIPWNNCFLADRCWAGVIVRVQVCLATCWYARRA